MPVENWVVEEEVYPIPKPDIRAVYIRLLEQIIETIKETKTIKFGEGEGENEAVTDPIYALPTVVFAYFNTDTSEDYALAQLYCYSDRREFLKDLTSYGDEDYLKEYGLEDPIRPPAS